MQRPFRVPLLAAAALSILAISWSVPPLTAQQPERATFYVLLGNDTIAIERMTRRSGQLEGELLDQLHGARWTYTAALAPNALVTRMENAVFRRATDTVPVQRAVLQFVGDSVIVTVGGAATGTQRIASRGGALPYINLSSALMEQVLMRARTAGGSGAEVPLFLISGGQTVPAMVTWTGRDSALVTIAGVSFRAATASQGRLLGATVPAQRVRFIRVEGLRTAAVRRTDYSAPPGAPYTAEEVTVQTPAGLRFTGTLTLPGASATSGTPVRRVPAVVTITGSGQEDRDEALPGIAGYRPFRQLADTLARRGIAVLRLDDRGMGGSDAGPPGATSADFADDIRAGLAYLRSRPEIDPARLGLVGHSEGGLIAPMIAATDTTLRGIVLLAGPARTGREILAFQQRQAIARNTQLSAAQRDSLIAASAHATDSLGAVQPWMRYFLVYNPLATARRVKTPVLILQGATDHQVTADQAPELAAAFRASGDRDVTVKVFPETNHLFLVDPNGDVSGYAALPSKAVRPEVLGAVADWLSSHLR